MIMTPERIKFDDIDKYIASFPVDTQNLLEQIRVTVRNAAPGAKETISYGMPAFYLKGNLVYFAAFKNHIGFYPTAAGIEAFKSELSVYEVTKGTVRFPFDKPIPGDLITRIVKFRVKQNLEKVKTKERS
jgi:uncharacterized protein YdhG (YjbR/CyaY superfamily)